MHSKCMLFIDWPDRKASWCKLVCEVCSHLRKVKQPLLAFSLCLHVHKQSHCQFMREAAAPINVTPKVVIQVVGV